MVTFRDCPLEGYEKYYSIGIDGTIISNEREINNNGTIQILPEHIMKPQINRKRNNYAQICLCVDNFKTPIKIHKLVALAFPEICGEYFEGAEVDHKDGNVLNNSAFNLHWVNKKENMANPVTRAKMEKNWKDSSRNKKISERMKKNNPMKNKEVAERVSKTKIGKAGTPRYSQRKKVGYYKDNESVVFASMLEAHNITGDSIWSIRNSIINKIETKRKIKWVLF